MPDVDIVCFSLARWDAPISSPAWSMAKEFAKNHRVFFIDHPFSYKDVFLGKNASQVASRRPFIKNENKYIRRPEFPEKLIAVSTPLTYPINFLPPGSVYDQLADINNEQMLAVLQRLITDQNISNFIFINFFDPFFLGVIPRELKPMATIYHCMDDISQVAYTNRHGLRLEELAIKHADFTLCTSRELVRLKEHLSRKVYYFPNAADVDLFKTAVNENLSKPKELENVTTPVVGFIGSIEYRSDFSLLKKLAEKHQDKTLVFVGPISTNEHQIAGLTEMENVIFVGAKELSALPSFLKYFDCAIIPYKKNTLTRSIYPLKINEYLAAGKPVVCTAFSAEIKQFEDVCYVAEDEQDFLQLVDIAIDQNTAELQSRRLAFAELNSWKCRVEDFWKIILQDLA